MAIAENQLVTWANLPSSKQHRDTYASIRGVLLDSNSPYASRSKDVYLQGSYGNDTNVYGDSDVDIVICSDASFDHDLTHLSQAQADAFKRDHPGTGLTVGSFRDDVYNWLRRHYGNDVQPPKKAVHINEQPHRRQADVLPCIEHRRYRHYNSLADNSYFLGVQFYAADGTKIVNFPKEHSKHCTAKHGYTSDRFKPTVRIFKNMRNAMINKRIINDGLAPSYYIEGMLWNVPHDHYVGTHAATVPNCLNWLNKADKTKLLCAHQLRWLLRDGAPDSWPPGNFDQFLAATIKFWNAGG